jgi:hypothetical protein
MTCAHARQRMSAYIDGELPDDQRLPLEAHMAACPACIAELRSLQRVVQGLRGLVDVPVPPEIARGVRARLTPASARHPWWTILLEPHPVTVSLAAIALVALAVVLMALKPDLSRRTARALRRVSRAERTAVTAMPVRRDVPSSPRRKPRERVAWDWRVNSFDEAAVVMNAWLLPRQGQATMSMDDEGLTIELLDADVSALLHELSRHGMVTIPSGGATGAPDAAGRVRLRVEISVVASEEEHR